MYYHMTVAGVERDLPICKVTDDLYIGAFVIFGDVELTEKCAAALLEKAPAYDYLITAEAKGIPLIHEMARVIFSMWQSVLSPLRRSSICIWTATTQR